MTETFYTAAQACPRTALRERKARVLARFTLADARVMCRLDGSSPTRFDPCPACRQNGLNFIIEGSGLRRPRLTDDPAAADRVVCTPCGFRGDAVLFVQAAFSLTHTAAALDRIEAWLAHNGG